MRTKRMELKMALDDILKMSGGSRDKEIDLSEESVMKHIAKFRDIISYWRLYPDRFIDYLCSLNPKNSFHLYFYQRFKR